MALSAVSELHRSERKKTMALSPKGIARGARGVAL